jgi:TolB-like protein
VRHYVYENLRQIVQFGSVRMKKRLACFLLFLTACSFGPGNLQSRHSSDLEARRIRRIAVVPPSVLSGEARSKVVLGTTPEPGNTDRDAAESLARIAHSVMAGMPNWQIVSENEVREVGQTLAPSSEAVRLRQIGQGVYADAVLAGRMQRYRERVGDEWGAKSPASVAFVLDLVDVRRGDVIWSVRFDETQKSLSENIFALGDIGQRGVRWLTAEQLTQEGVKKSVAQLHQIIARSPAP